MRSIRKTFRYMLVAHAVFSGSRIAVGGANGEIAAPEPLEKQAGLTSPNPSGLTKDVVEVVIKDFDTERKASSGQASNISKGGSSLPPGALSIPTQPSTPSQGLAGSAETILQISTDTHPSRPDGDLNTEGLGTIGNKANTKESFKRVKKDGEYGERQNQLIDPDKELIYKDIANRNMDLSAQKTWSHHPYEKCYITNTDLVPMSEIGKVVDQFEAYSNSVRFIYKKNILGFAFCTSNSAVLDKIRGKYSLINIEEDKVFRIGSVENDMRHQHSTRARNTSASNFEEGFFDLPNRGDSPKPRYVGGAVRYSANGMVQSPVPVHLYRIMNMGNVFFNNYLLDNFVFRVLGISGMIRYFYKYEHFYTGRNVKVTIIDTPKCNEHKYINASLISGFENSLAKNAALHIIEGFSCNGTIKLSKLLDILENMHRTDILVLPFSGPYSEALNLSLKRMGQNTIIITASGNDSENSCNHSPSGHHLIKVGSVDKHGYISTFSNRGSCTDLYSLGEDILGGNGTSYSASFVASAVSVFMEKHPGASHDKVLRHLMENTMKNEYDLSILKIPRVDPRAEKKAYLPYYTWKEVIIYNAAVLIVVMVMVYILLRVYRRYRTMIADSQYILGSLREDRLQ